MIKNAMIKQIILSVLILFAHLFAISHADKVTETLSQSVYKELKDAGELIDVKGYAQALEIVRNLRKNTKLTEYESSQTWNVEAYVYYLKENYKQALSAYYEVLKYEGLAEAVIQSTLKTVAQLHFIQEEYKPAISAINRLIARVDDPDVSLYMLQGQGYYQLKEYDKALTALKLAVKKEKATGNKPKEKTLLLLRAIYYEKNDFKNMLVVLKEVIRYYPKDRYLYTLAAIYSELGDTKKQMALTEVLFEKGYLDGEKHAVNLANLYLLHGIPYKAAILLQKEIDANRVQSNERNLRLLAHAWYQAKDDQKAIPPMRLAAKKSRDGDLYIRLAQSYINLELWPQAVEAIRSGLAKGRVDKPDVARIMLGTALFNMHKLDEARNAFSIAAKSVTKSDRKIANTWLTFLDSEIRRIELAEETSPDFIRSLDAQENIKQLL